MKHATDLSAESERGLRVEGLQFLDRGPMSLKVPLGRVHGLSGPSGSGKSILLRAIADLMPNHGIVSWRGQSRDTLPPQNWRRRVCLLPANPVWWYDTVGEHLRSDAVDWLPMLGFAEDVLSWDVARLSSGERQRLALVRLLGVQPECLLLDEPMANLDAVAARGVDEVIGRFVGEPKDNRSALVVSHDPEWLAQTCSGEWIIREGKLVER